MLNEVLTEGANEEQGIVRLPCEDVAVNKLKKGIISSVCVCERERERERQTDRQTDSERDERVLKEGHDCRIYIIVYFKILLGI